MIGVKKEQKVYITEPYKTVKSYCVEKLRFINDI